MPQHVNVTVGADEAELVREALLSLYAARATNVADHVGIADAERLREVRAELTDAERMLDAFGWEHRAGVEAAQLCGPEAAVGEVLRLALSDAHGSVGAALEAYHRGAAELDQVIAASERLRALLGRFAAYEREHAL
jgi:hypothetical protein